MNRLLCRPSRAFLPLAISLCALTGDAERAAGLFLGWMLTRACSLSASSAFRTAASGIVNPARLQGCFLLSGGMTVLGGIISALIGTKLLAVPCDLAIAGAAAELGILASERLSADRERSSSFGADLLLAILAAVGLLLSRSGGPAAPVCIGIGTLITLALCLSFFRKTAPAFYGKLFLFLPRAFLRELLLPGALAVLCAVCPMRFSVFVPGTCAALFEGTRTVFRRSEGESAPSVLLMTAIPAAAIPLCTLLGLTCECAGLLPAALLLTSGSFLMLFEPVTLRTLLRVLFLLLCGFCGMAHEGSAFLSFLSPGTAAILTIPFALCALATVFPEAKDGIRRFRAGKLRRKHTAKL